MGFIRLPIIETVYIDDTAWSHRIWYWKIAYAISKVHDFKFTILCDYHNYLEYLFIDFPYTNFYFGNIDWIRVEKKDYSHLSFSNHILITPENIESLEFNVNGNYLLDFNFGSPLEDVPQWIKDELPSCSILKLREKNLETIIKEKVKDRTGIHLRMIDTYIYDKRGIDKLIKAAGSELEAFAKLSEDNSYYLATDINDKRFPYKETIVRYDGSVCPTYCEVRELIPDYTKYFKTEELYDKYDIIDYSEIMNSMYPDMKIRLEEKLDSIVGNTQDMAFDTDYEITMMRIFRDVIDIYSLVYSKEFIPSKDSTYSHTVHDFRGEEILK